MKRLIVVVALGGCSFGATPSEALRGDGGPLADAPGGDGPAVDASGSVGEVCFGEGLVEICFAAAPSDPVTLRGTLDTGVDATCTQRVTQAGIELCVIAGRTIDVVGSVPVIGVRPLVLVAADVITVNSTATLDLSSLANNARKGAGANTGPCTTIAKAESAAGGGGGGGGGGLGTPGGPGGEGDKDDSDRSNGKSEGGVPGETRAATAFRGGCPGGAGGNGSGTQPGGVGGDGGGAVYLIAGRTLTISGNVFASGAGGGANAIAAAAQQGAGGGGSGGMIGLDAPAITVSGRVVANGGAGGGGGGETSGGSPGGDGTTVAFDTAAAGGVPAADNDDGRGANGTAISNTVVQEPEEADAGGGGGGGGLGIVVIDGSLNGGAAMSPAPSAH